MRRRVRLKHLGTATAPRSAGSGFAGVALHLSRSRRARCLVTLLAPCHAPWLPRWTYAFVRGKHACEWQTGQAGIHRSPPPSPPPPPDCSAATSALPLFASSSTHTIKQGACKCGVSSKCHASSSLSSCASCGRTCSRTLHTTRRKRKKGGRPQAAGRRAFHRQR